MANQEALNTNRRSVARSSFVSETKNPRMHASIHIKAIMFQRLSRAIYINGIESTLLN